MYEILGKYKREAREVIDQADDMETVNYLIAEYRMAYGPEWIISYRKVKDHVCECASCEQYRRDHIV